MNTSNKSEFPIEVNVFTSSSSKVLVLVNSLGDGAFNTAYLAHEKGSPQRQFVYKRYKSGQEEKNHEVTILSAIRSHDMNAPVVKVFDSEVTDQNGQKGHTEELAAGKKISETIPSDIQALKLSIKFAQLLKTCAEEDIAYRDVKPFDHVFWEPDKKDGVKNMTVIDWNISRRPASLGDLYFDLVEYCRCLPEFFLGNRPLSGRRYYHPLSWNYDENVRKSITSVLWVVLSSISFNYSCPSILNGGKVLEIGRLDKETIIGAWENIIKLLNDVLSILNDPKKYSELLDGFPDELYLNLEQWLQSPDSVRVETLLDEKIYKWPGRFEFTTPPRHVLDENEPVLTYLRVAHMISGGAFRETLLFSFFLALYRTGVYSDVSARQYYENILEGLVDARPPSQIYNNETKIYFEKLAEIAKIQVTQDDSELQKMAGQIWGDLERGFKAWTICDAIEKAGNLRDKQKLLEELDHQHPLYAKFKADLKREEEQRDQLRELGKSIEDGNFENAKRLVKKIYGDDEKSKNSFDLKIDFCKRLYSLRGKKVGELSVDEVEVLVKDAPRSSLPDTYQSQLNDLREKLPELKKLQSWQKDLQGAGDANKFEQLYHMTAGNFDDQVAKPLWVEAFRNYVHKRIEYVKKIQVSQSVEDWFVFEKLVSEFEQLYTLCSDVGATELLKNISTTRNYIDSVVTNLEPMKEHAVNSFIESNQQELNDADNQPDKLKDIVDKLNDPVNERLLKQDWLAAQREKVRVLWNAAKFLQNIRENENAEWKINEVIDKLQNYPEGGTLLDELSTHQANSSFRQQILGSIERTNNKQVEGFDSIKQEVEKINTEMPNALLGWFKWDERYKQLSEKIELIEKKSRRTGGWTIAFGIINFLLLLGILFFSIVNLKTSSTQNEPSAPTANVSRPTANVSSSEVTQPPTLAPTVTSVPPSPTQQVNALLLPNAIFYADDKVTELWVISSGQTVAVEILTVEDGFSYVQMKAVIGLDLIDQNTMKIKHTSVKIRTFEDVKDPIQIGTPKSIFSVEMIADRPPNLGEIYQPVILKGWVNNEFLNK